MKTSPYREPAPRPPEPECVIEGNVFYASEGFLVTDEAGPCVFEGNVFYNIPGYGVTFGQKTPG